MGIYGLIKATKLSNKVISLKFNYGNKSWVTIITISNVFSSTNGWSVVTDAHVVHNMYVCT